MPKYLLLVACRDLKNDDGSWALVSVVRMDSGEEEEIGKTAEVMGDTPVFDKVFEFEGSGDDLVKVTIMDENDQSRGVATYTVSTVLGHEKGLGYLEMSANRGAVVVHISEKSDKGSLKIKLRGKDLKNVEGFTNLRKPDPFYIFSRWSGQEWIKVYTSPAVRDELDPEWAECAIEVKELCEADFDLPLKLEVYDEERGDKHVIIGSCHTTVNQLLVAGSCLRLKEKDELTGKVFVENSELVGCIDGKAAARSLMSIVAVALESRSAANEKAESMEKLKEDAAKAKEAAEAAQLEADQKAQALEAAEGELGNLMAAAEKAEAEIGGLV